MASPMEVRDAAQTLMPTSSDATSLPVDISLLSRSYEQVGVSGILLSLLLVAIAYDQSECGKTAI